MTNDLDALFDGHRQKALGWLLLNPERSPHVRELARYTGAHAGSLHRELARLSTAGLLIRIRRGNQVHYQANTRSPIFDELAAIFRKTTGLAGLLRDALEPLANVMSTAFIYGSMAKGSAQAGSDIDLFVIGHVAFVELVASLHACQEKLGREINPSLYSPTEFQQKLLARDPFLREVIAQPKLFVLGSDDDLGQPGSHRATGSADTE